MIDLNDPQAPWRTHFETPEELGLALRAAADHYDEKQEYTTQRGEDLRVAAMHFDECHWSLSEKDAKKAIAERPLKEARATLVTVLDRAIMKGVFPDYVVKPGFTLGLLRGA